MNSSCFAFMKGYLQIKDEFIKRIIINQRAIEKVMLSDTRAAGDQLLLRLGGGGLAWTGDGYMVRRYPCVPSSLLF
jgi:structural maintenance of chromosomes protein 6